MSRSFHQSVSGQIQHFMKVLIFLWLATIFVLLLSGKNQTDVGRNRNAHQPSLIAAFPKQPASFSLSFLSFFLSLFSKLIINCSVMETFWTGPADGRHVKQTDRQTGGRTDRRACSACNKTCWCCAQRIMELKPSVIKTGRAHTAGTHGTHFFFFSFSSFFLFLGILIQTRS